MEPHPPDRTPQHSSQTLDNYQTTSALASWVFGGLILVFLMIVVLVPVEPSKFPIIRFLMALSAAFFAVFFVGGVLLKGTLNGLFISATGGFVLFVLIQFVFNPFSVLPTASGQPTPTPSPMLTPTPMVTPSTTPISTPTVSPTPTPKPSVSLTPSSSNIVLEKIEGNGQVIPPAGWKNFAVQVVDSQGLPVVGAKVAWQTPECGLNVYIGETNKGGVSSATNMCNALSAGTYTQTATLVDKSTLIGFTRLDRIVPIGKTVVFTFQQQ